MNIIKIEPMGLCPSCNYAVNKIKELLDNGEKLAIIKEVLHNKIINNSLKDKGLVILDDFSSYNDQYKMVIPLDSISINIKNKLTNYIDLACPKINAIHKFIMDNYSTPILFIGKKTHAEALAVKDYCNIILIEDESDLNNINIDANPIVINQTTYLEDKVIDLRKKILDKYPNALIKDTLCNIPLERKRNIKNTKCDLLIVVGDKLSANAKELLKGKENSILIESASNLDMDYLKKFNTIAVATAASTSIETANEVIEELKKL